MFYAMYDLFTQMVGGQPMRKFLWNFKKGVNFYLCFSILLCWTLYLPSHHWVLFLSPGWFSASLLVIEGFRWSLEPNSAFFPKKKEKILATNFFSFFHQFDCTVGIDKSNETWNLKKICISNSMEQIEKCEIFRICWLLLLTENLFNKFQQWNYVVNEIYTVNEYSVLCSLNKLIIL